MNVPALAALAPDGPTQTIVGIFECSELSILFMASSLPPGVSSWRITAAAPSDSARPIAPAT